MAKYLRYMGEFLSREGVAWKVELHQEAEYAYASVGSLTFEASEALTIEWPETGKEETVCGSSATLRLNSPGDRTYEDLYTIEPGQIRMDVYREGALYWSGALDSEFYEEPYEKASNYEVSLTFSDFGILDRLKYDLAGVQTLEAITLHALAKAGINYASLDQSLCTTCLSGSATPARLSDFIVRSDNFIDEEGEQSSLREALEGILQPLSLRITQKAGKIYVYDLNGLHALGNAQQIEWMGDSQTLGADKVANNVKITFSPYASSEVMGSDIEYLGEYGTDEANFTCSPVAGSPYGEFYTYLPEYYAQSRVTQFDRREASFSIFLGEGEGLEYVNPSAKHFHIEPLSGGQQADGVAWGLYGGGALGYLDSGFGLGYLSAAKLNILSISKGSSAIVLKTRKAYLPKLSERERAQHSLRISLDMLLDCRYCPFTESQGKTDGTGNRIDNYWENDNALKKYTAWAFVPVGINLCDASGTPIMHYDNEVATHQSASGIPGAYTGSWKSGAATFGKAWLEWYDPEDLEEGTGVRGWKTNRHCIGRPDVSHRRDAGWVMYDSFKSMPDGEYIPYPDQAGYLEIIVYEGVLGYQYGESVMFADADTQNTWDKKGMYGKLRWLLYKEPKAEVVKNDLVFSEASLDDIEYSGWLNRSAKDGIGIDTIVGTSPKGCPTARGLLCLASTGEQASELTRAGVTDCPERLLIGTLYSQYADRRTKLSGEAALDAGGLKAYTEANQGEKKFIMLGEIQDCIADITEATLSELRPDEYEGIEEAD